MTFAGTIGGHQVQFNGTIQVTKCILPHSFIPPIDSSGYSFLSYLANCKQEIHVHMKKVHPEFDPDALYAANKNISARQNDFNIGAQFAGGLVGRGGKVSHQSKLTCNSV